LKILVLRPYYGANICGDMIGDLGLFDYIDHVFPDFHLVYTASLIKELNGSIDVIDANAEKLLPDTVVARINERYDTILLKAQMPTVQLDIEFARCLKKLYPETNIVLIGSIAFILRDWIIENVPEIDVASSIMIEDYAYELITGKQHHVTLDELPTPDFTLFPYKKYHNSRGAVRGALYTSRGCKTMCGYCPYAAYYKGMYEERSLEKLETDIRHLLSLGIRYISFRDQNFSFKKERILAVCRMFKEKKLEFKWETDSRIDVLDKETIDAMIDSGLEMLAFGVETTSEEILNTMHRPVVDISRFTDLIKHLKEKNVQTLAFYMIGFPGESWDSISDTYNLAVSLDSTYANFNVLNTYVGTRVWEEYKNYNDLTPELFTLFKRRMNFVLPNGIEPEKMDFIAQFLNNKYIGRHNDFENLYAEYRQEQNEKDRYTKGYKISKSFFQRYLNDSRLKDGLLFS
jgi:anaerobic magnesium-protoporphyrin IX monomethyl ester cyclase